MNSASLSMKVFGGYVAVIGVGLLLAPALVFAPLGLPAPADAWVRVLGALSIVVSYYYWRCGSEGVTAFMRASVMGRMIFAVLCVALVATRTGPIQLLLFGAIDALSALWTARALKSAAAVN